MADTYTITSQRQAQDFGPDGSFQPVVEVSFVTKPSGVVGSVKVPEANYDVATVDKMVADRVAMIEEIHAL